MDIQNQVPFNESKYQSTCSKELQVTNQRGLPLGVFSVMGDGNITPPQNPNNV